MDLSTLFGSLQTTLGAKLPGILGVLGGRDLRGRHRDGEHWLAKLRKET